MTRRKSEPLTRAEGPKRPISGDPISDVPTWNLDNLKAMDDRELLDFARKQCRKYSINTRARLFRMLGDLADVLEERNLHEVVFARPRLSSNPVSSAPPTSPPSKRSMPPEPPIRSSIIPPAPAENTIRPQSISQPPQPFSPVPVQRKIQPSESIEYDRTEGVESSREIPDPKAVLAYMEILKSGPGDFGAKIKKALSFYETELKRARRLIPNMAKVLAVAQQKQKAQAVLSRDEQYLIALIALKKNIELTQALQRQQANLRIASSGPETTNESDIVQAQMINTGKRPSEPPRKSETPEPEVSFVRRIISSPMTDAVLIVSVVAAATHATNSFRDLANGFKNLISFIPGSLNWSDSTERLVAMGSFYGIAAIGFGITEAARRKKLALDAEKIEKMEKLTETQKKAFSYAVGILTNISRETGIPKLQASQLRSQLINDEKFLTAVDLFYPSKVIWADLMNESRLHDAVQAEFGKLKRQAETQVIGKRLDKIFRGKDSIERKRTFQELYETNEIFRRKMEELFAKDQSGDYINSGLRESVGKLKFEKPLDRIDMNRALESLEEIYQEVVRNNIIERGGVDE